MRFRQIDKAVNFINGDGYTCTNEDPECFERLLGERTFKRILAIGSGGEISFVNLLPRCEGELIAVDHMLQPCYAFWLKAELLRRLGVERFLEALQAKNDTLLRETHKEIWRDFPEPLREFREKHVARLSQVPEDFPYYMSIVTYIEKWWLRYFPANAREKLHTAIERLDRLTLVHGDLLDCAEMGPFDLIYLSNAQSHRNRAGYGFPTHKILDMLTPGGLVLTTSTVLPDKDRPSRSRLVGSKLGGRNEIGWEHQMWEVANA